MSCSRRSEKVDLKLNLSLLPTASGRDEASPQGYASSSSLSSPSSCLSSEAELGLRSPVSPTAAPSMVLAGCPRCLMYVMLSAADLRCPKCSSTVLLDFYGGGAAATTTTTTTATKNKKGRMSYDC